MSSISELVDVPAIIREVLYPPPCPEEVAALFDAALTYQNQSNFALALRTLLLAQHKWEVLRGWSNVSEEDKARFAILPDAQKDAFLRNDLVPVAVTDEAEVFIRLSMGSVFESAGRDERALAEITHAAKIAANLRPDHPSHATVASCLGSVYTNIAQYDLAADLFLRALDARESRLGPRHPDTGLALHNVAVVLHRVDRCPDAMPLYTKAEAILSEHFRPSHPRLLLCQRNIQRCHRRVLKFGPHGCRPPVTLPCPTYAVPVLPAATTKKVAKPKPKAKER
eukprot:TRINITY_DN56308_c0_g1_i1.p1 TRINITY_DN56308_c0_g1~~TRINITY_DN56308_c0_g1_i1.p1  ORF type:complete len:282 (+),score=34.45 TRINITY_DN56308_c0_g1_i1:231-1076(+)